MALVASTQAAVRLYQNEHPDHCPRFTDLHRSGELAASHIDGVDRWSTPLRIECPADGYQIAIHSAGPDRRFDTADDITLPRPN